MQLAVGRAGRDLAAAAGVPVGTGLLDVHVPATGGPLSPAACTRSLAVAPGVLAQLHPGLDPALVTCHSWLLDEELWTLLPVDSNIRAFANRFSLLPVSRDGRGGDGGRDGGGGGGDPDGDLRRFLFTVPPGTDVADLPRDSSLRRAVADRMAAGRQFHTRTGWARLPGSVPGSVPRSVHRAAS